MDEGDEIIVVGVYPQLSNNEEDPKQKAEEIIDWIMKSHQGDKVYSKYVLQIQMQKKRVY